jgi:hypothetical protein
MHKLVFAFLLFYIANVIGGGIMEGAGGLASTTLTVTLTSGGGTLTVRNTDAFLKSDRVFIGDEEIRYVTKTATTFTVSATGRGYNGTKAVTHNAGAKVYSPSTSVINGMLGFNVAATDTTVASINLPILLWNFVSKSLPKLLSWDFPQYKGSEWAQLIRYILMAVSAGFTIYIVVTLLGAWGGVAQSIFKRP